MAIVNIPATMRAVAGGAAQVEVPGATLGELVDNLEARFPGCRRHLVDDDDPGRLMAGLAVWIDGDPAPASLRTRLRPESEVYFAPAIAGGLAGRGLR